MAEKPNMDPLTLWRDMLGQWERGVNSVANQAMGSDEFSRAMHQVTSMGLRMQQTMGEMLGKSLEALNLPTRNDLIAISERLARIEARLDDISANAAAHQPPAKSAPPKSAPAKVPRTRKPPAA